jgi:hypothetical protein
MDRSEIVIVGGHPVYSRPDLAARRAYWPELAGVPAISETIAAARLGGESCGEQFIPVGQDGAFARSFAAEYISAGALVQASAHSSRSTSTTRPQRNHCGPIRIGQVAALRSTTTTIDAF